MIIGRHTLLHADCIEAMREMEPDSVDAIVTDPPYGLGFMGKKWDALPPGEDWARECLRVAKPGAHLIAFGGQRTIHRLTTALEDAGWEIRDQLQWLQWQGFPKSMDISKAIDRAAGAERFSCNFCRDAGWAFSEGSPCPECSGLKRTKNLPVFQKGRGFDGKDSDGRPIYKGINGGHLPSADLTITEPATEDAKRWEGWGTALKPASEPCILARKPISERSIAANVLRWGTGAINVDGCRYAYGDSAWPGPQEVTHEHFDGRETRKSLFGRRTLSPPHDLGRFPSNVYACPKASRSEREAGCEELARKVWDDTRDPDRPGSDNPRNRAASARGNDHPTCKPIALMRWLVRLVTPPGGTVLEPFAGSGTTMIAADLEGFASIGIEREADYLPIIQARLRHWAQAMTVEEATAKAEPGALPGQRGLF